MEIKLASKSSPQLTVPKQDAVRNAALSPVNVFEADDVQKFSFDSVEQHPFQLMLHVRKVPHALFLSP